MQTDFSLKEIYDVVERYKMDLQIAQLPMDADLIDLDNILTRRAAELADDLIISFPFGIYTDDEKMDMYVFILETTSYLQKELSGKSKQYLTENAKMKIPVGEFERKMRDFRENANSIKRQSHSAIMLEKLIDSPEFKSIPKDIELTLPIWLPEDDTDYFASELDKLLDYFETTNLIHKYHTEACKQRTQDVVEKAATKPLKLQARRKK